MPLADQMRDRRKARRNVLPSSEVPPVVSWVRPVDGPASTGVLFVDPDGHLRIRHHHTDMGCRQLNRWDDPFPVYIADDGNLWRGPRIILREAGSDETPPYLDH